MNNVPYTTDLNDKTKVYISETCSIPRYIVCAANKFEIPFGEDIIVCGARHHDKLMREILNALKVAYPNGCAHGDQGFVDQYQQWVSRQDAKDIVVANKQHLRDSERLYDELYSENLY